MGNELPKWPRQYAYEIWDKPKSEWLEALEEVPVYWREFVKDHLRDWHLKSKIKIPPRSYRRSKFAKRKICRCGAITWHSKTKSYGFKILNPDCTEHTCDKS